VRRTLGSLLALLLTTTGPAIAFASGNLGVAVQVLPALNEPTSSSDPHSTNLTFLLKPGESASRVLQVQNTGNVPGKFSLRLAYSHLVNGVPVFDETKASEIEPWFSLGNSTLVIPPGSTANTSVKLSIPKGTPIGIHEGTIFITADPVNATSGTKGSKAVIKSNVRIALSFFLGIGDTSQIVTLFAIEGVSESFLNAQPLLLVRIRNTGKLPIAPSGSIVLEDPHHIFTVGAPITFNSGTIEPGLVSEVAVPLPRTIPEGSWSALTTVNQGTVQQSQRQMIIIHKVKPKNFLGILFKIILVLIFSLLVIFGLTLLRRKSDSQKNSKSDLGDAKNIDLESLLLDIQAREEEPMKKRDRKKVATKKVATKKKVAKKAPTKKAPTKKAPAKKAPTKKAPAKKAPAKSSKKA